MLNTIKLGCRAETEMNSIGLDNKGTKAEIINARVEKYLNEQGRSSGRSQHLCIETIDSTIDISKSR